MRNEAASSEESDRSRTPAPSDPRVPGVPALRRGGAGLSIGFSQRKATVAHNLMNLPATQSGGRRWIKIGTGLCGLALVIGIGWMVLKLELPRNPRTAADGPPSTPVRTPATSTEPASSPRTTTPDTAAGGPPPSGAAPGTASRQDSGAPPAVEAAANIFRITVRLERGDTIDSVLRDLDLAPVEIGIAVDALRPHLKMTRLKVDQAITVQIRAPADPDVRPVLEGLAIRPEDRRYILLHRDAQGGFSVQEKTFEGGTRLVRASGTIDSSLITSLDAAGVPASARVEMVQAFAWDVSFQHDMKAGDRFDVLVEQPLTSAGKPAEAARVLRAELTTGGGAEILTIYRFKPRQGPEFFFFRNGESVVKELLRTPLSLSHVAPRAGMHRHPVPTQGPTHKGIDFAAPAGTPVLAAGDGKVMQAGRIDERGNRVQIGHDRGLTTGYVHLLRIVRGIRQGAQVRQGQVIGFVGGIGLSIGPHLRFELDHNGQAADPLSIARTSPRRRLAGKDLVRFEAAVARLDRARDGAELMARP
jgi:murein DD-endopeptidase MepM/ murein hydrolase activator NlpD